MSLARFFFHQLKHARRYNKIISVLIKYGFEDYVAHASEKRRFSVVRRLMSKRRFQRAKHMSRWERMRMVAEELGPTFIKFGQVLSNRPDLVPQELIDELVKLQDGVPPFPFQKVEKIVEEEFGLPINQIFKDLSPVPVASASMAQVHKASLLNGDVVVLKIQRPGIRKTIEDDIKIMIDIAALLADRIPSVRSFDPVNLVNQFSTSIQHELDFIHEASNMYRFHWNFKDDETTTCPKVHEELKTSRIITMEYFDGVKISSIGKLEERGLDRKVAAKRVLDSFFKQVFDNGFFHADPHAGNIMVLKDNVVGFLDFGMMGSILKKDMQLLGNLLLAMETQNVKAIIRALEQLTEKSVFKDPKQFEYDVDDFVNRYAYMPEFEKQVSTMLQEIINIVVKHEMTIPAHFFLLTRAMFSIEGVVRHVDPELIMFDELRPYLVNLVRGNYNPLVFGRKLLTTAYDFGSYMQDFPYDLRQTMSMLKRGELKVDLQHGGIDPFIHTLNRVSRQMVAAIITGSLVVGSSLMVSADLEPKTGSIPTLSLIGYILASLIGIGMFFNLLKKDKGY